MNLLVSYILWSILKICLPTMNYFALKIEDELNMAYASKFIQYKNFGTWKIQVDFVWWIHLITCIGSISLDRMTFGFIINHWTNAEFFWALRDQSPFSHLDSYFLLDRNKEDILFASEGPLRRLQTIQTKNRLW